MDGRQRQERARNAAQGYLGHGERVLVAGHFTGAPDGPLSARHVLLAVTDRHLVVLGVQDRSEKTPRVRREIARWSHDETRVVTRPVPDRPVLVIAPKAGELMAVRGGEGDTVAGALLALGAAEQPRSPVLAA